MKIPHTRWGEVVRSALRLMYDDEEEEEEELYWGSFVAMNFVVGRHGHREKP